ncbi:MAG: DUF721 domain-containing protein [Calditrichaeota bacterium]|nr:MAG: DUF721 domain-containing protein [Calditrichota bacterium]
MAAMPASPEKHIGDAIFKLFKALGMKERFEENMALFYWDSTVGKEIARHTEPMKVNQGILFVKVDNDAWRNELTFLKHEIIQKLNEKLGKKTIEEIKFY